MTQDLVYHHCLRFHSDPFALPAITPPRASKQQDDIAASPHFNMTAEHNYHVALTAMMLKQLEQADQVMICPLVCGSGCISN